MSWEHKNIFPHFGQITGWFTLRIYAFFPIPTGIGLSSSKIIAKCQSWCSSFTQISWNYKASFERNNIGLELHKLNSMKWKDTDASLEKHVGVLWLDVH
jgi:hypothetical protein